jgi:NADP-dependent 3-hydroxy acid dehydrogenase YdfG
MFDVNVIALLNSMQLVLGDMKERSKGTIINISSVAGKKSFPNHAAYVGTKFAVSSISENVREEVNKRLPDLIAQIEPVYKKSERLKAVSGGVVERKSVNKASASLKAKKNNVEVQAITDSLNFMQQGIRDIKKSINQDLEEVSNEIFLLLDELDKISKKVA